MKDNMETASVHPRHTNNLEDSNQLIGKVFLNGVINNVEYLFESET